MDHLKNYLLCEKLHAVDEMPVFVKHAHFKLSSLHLFSTLRTWNSALKMSSAEQESSWIDLSRLLDFIWNLPTFQRFFCKGKLIYSAGSLLRVLIQSPWWSWPGANVKINTLSYGNVN